MSHPKVSVVVTCYNYAHFLPFALESALKQTYPNVEVVVVNDGSRDNTDDVMRPYADDPRVVYIKQENAGQAVAKNVGIAASTGEFVAFLDADDVWAANKLELQLPLFSNPGVGVVYSGMSFIDESGKAIDGPKLTKLSAPRAGWITEALFVDNVVPFSSAIVRKVCLLEHGAMDPSYKMAIDWDLWLRLSVHVQFAYVNEALLHYRIGHVGQMSKNLHVRERDTLRIMQNFLSRNPGLLPRSLISWVMAYSYCLWGYRSRGTDGWKSMRCYLKAIAWRKTHFDAYFGLLKLVGYKVLSLAGISR